jgi:hypothetical protein
MNERGDNLAMIIGSSSALLRRQKVRSFHASTGTYHTDHSQTPIPPPSLPLLDESVTASRDSFPTELNAPRDVHLFRIKLYTRTLLCSTSLSLRNP